MAEIELIIKNERLQKDVEVALEENVILSGTMTIREGALTEGVLEIRAYGEDGKTIQQYIPLGFRIANGKITLAPGRMEPQMMAKVLSVIDAIEEAFAEEIAKSGEPEEEKEE